jgi:uncharacterized membrane protein (DUF106 family)
MDTVIGILIWAFIIGGIINYFVQKRRKDAEKLAQSQDTRQNSTGD